MSLLHTLYICVELVCAECRYHRRRLIVAVYEYSPVQRTNVFTRTISQEEWLGEGSYGNARLFRQRAHRNRLIAIKMMDKTLVGKRPNVFGGHWTVFPLRRNAGVGSRIRASRIRGG